MLTVDLTSSLTPPGTATWQSIAAMASDVGATDWAIVGGQMVLIHAAAFGVAPPRVTTDGDIVVDVRSFGRQAMKRIARSLLDAGFTMETSPEGISRFTRQQAKIDLLAPDGMGTAAIVTAAPGRAVQAPGTTQALERTEVMTVQFGDQFVAVRCPSLLGAIIAKASAVSGIPATTTERLKHQRDLAFLLSLAALGDLRAMQKSMTAKDRRRLIAGGRDWLDSDLHAAWSGIAERSDVRTAAAVLLSL
jgi:hypothetical protein